MTPLDPKAKEEITSRLDFSGTLTVGVEHEPALKRVLGHRVRTPKDYVEAGCRIAAKYRFATVACWPFQLDWTVERLEGKFPKTQMVVNFPYGTMPLEMALLQMKWGLDRGAEEIDAVVPVHFLQTGDYRSVRRYVRELQGNAIRFGGIEVKFIIRIGDLMRTEEEIRTLRRVRAAARAVAEGGGAYVKTCTGWEDGKATVRIVRTLKETVEGFGTKVKASGGITCLEDGLNLIEAGADRIAGRWPVVAQLEYEERR